jgi:hypothetical protein
MLRKTDRLISTIGGQRREFTFDRFDPSRQSLRNAEQALKLHESVVTGAANARAQAEGMTRPLNRRELESGVWGKQAELTHAEKAAAALHNRQPIHDADPNVNYQVPRVAELESQLARAYRPGDKEKIQKRLDIARNEAAKKQAEIEVKQARADYFESMPYKDAYLDALTTLNLLSVNPNSKNADVQEARQRMAALEAGGSIDEYWNAPNGVLAFEKRRDEDIAAKVKDKQREAGLALAEAAQIRNRELGTATETPATMLEPVIE